MRWPSSILTIKRYGRPSFRCHQATACSSLSDQALNWPPTPPHFIDVTDLAEEMRRDVRGYTSSCRDPIRLAGILAVECMDGLPGAEVYSTHVAETLSEDGIEYEHIECPGEEPGDVETAIEEMNQRPDIHGIIVYYPIFKNRMQGVRHGPYLNASAGVYYKSYDDYLRDAVRSEKDVEGLRHNYNSRRHFRARRRSNDRKQGEIYVPCTALAVERVLEAHHHFPNDYRPASAGETTRQLWMGVTATVINRSEIFGRPLAAMLALKGATVYSVDEHSILHFKPCGKIRMCAETHVTLDWCLQQSSIVVLGVPKPDFRLSLKSLVSENLTVVNVSEFDNVNGEEILERRDISFIPNIGKVTVAALELNLISLHRKSRMIKQGTDLY